MADSDDLIRVPLFPTQGRGFGYGIIPYSDALPEGYERTINMTVREQVLSPSFSASAVGLLSVYFGGAAPSFGVPWEDTDGTPNALFGLYSAAFKISNNATSSETDATSAAYAGAAFHDDGAGTAYLYAGTSTGSKLLNRRTQAGTWAEDADVSAIYVVSAGGALWRTTSDYQISKCPAGSDPFTVGNWGAAIQVGTSEAAITAIGAIGAAPVIFKEDGVYVYNEADNRFANEYAVPLHPSNFRFVKPDGQGGLVTAVYDGTLVRIHRFGAITVINPLDGKTVGRDTPHGPILDVEVIKGKIYALMAPAYRLVKPSGMKVLKTTDNFSTFTDYSANAIDNDYSTGIDISSLDTLANGDALLVGFDHPVLALHLLVTAANGNAATLTLGVSTGAGTWTTLLTVPSGANAAYDQTNVSAGGTTGALGQAGMILFREGVALSTWVTATYNSLTKYWVRMTVSAALDAAVTIGEIAAVIKRKGPNFTTTNADNAEDFEASGMFGKILVGKFEEGDVLWDDMFTVWTSNGDGRLAATRMPSAGSIERSLVYFDRGALSIFPIPFLDDPSVAAAPILAGDGLTANANFHAKQCSPVFYPSAVRFDEPMELAYIECHGRNFTSGTDGWQVAFRWDDTSPWEESEVAYQSIARFAFMGPNFGSVLHTAVRIIDGSTSEMIGPSGVRLTAWVRRSARDAWDITQPDRATPEES